MKRTIKQGLLGLGGYKAAQQVYSMARDRLLIRRIRAFLDTGVLPQPDMLVLEPTQRCNLSCAMCCRDVTACADGNEMTFGEITGFLEETPYLKTVALNGGEIFIRKDMVGLIQAISRDRDIVISTNGTLLSRDEMKALGSCKRIYTVCVSLDGPRALHDRIRGMYGAFDRTVDAIRYLTRLFPVTVSAVIMTENLESLKDVVGISAGLGVRKVKFEMERIIKGGRVRGYSVEDLERTVRDCLALGRKAGVTVAFDPWFLPDEPAACHEGALRKKRRYICRAFSIATIAPNGDLIHCFALRMPFGNVLKSPLAAIWNSEPAVRFRTDLLKDNMTSRCENCPFLVPWEGSRAFSGID